MASRTISKRHFVAASLIAFTANAAAFEVKLAPDKDLPIAYPGEPIIIQLLSDRDERVEGYLTLTGPANDSRTFGPIALWAGEARWVILEDFGQAFGVYDAELVLNGEVVSSGQFARMHAPRPSVAGPILIANPEFSTSSPSVFGHTSLTSSLSAGTLRVTQRGELALVLVEAAAQGSDRIVSKAITPEILAPTIISALAEGYDSVELDMDALLRDGFPTNELVAATWLNRVLHSVDFVGPLPGADANGGDAFVFHSPDGAWMLWAWNASAPTNIDLDFTGLDSISIHDPMGNLLPSADIVDNSRINALCVTGKGGRILRTAAEARARTLARELTELSGASEEIPSDLRDIAASLSGFDDPTVNRFAFFGLIRALPELEQARTLGAIPMAAATQSAALIAALSRSLAVLEQENGTPFLEPLHETIARCVEFRDNFAAHARSPRGQWLIGEVDRLLAEAKWLDSIARPIEADAVASIAEWRARSLSAHVGDVQPETKPAPEEEGTDK